MGFKIACIAVDENDYQIALSALGLIKLNRSDPHNEAPFSGAIGVNGKYIIWKNTSDADFSETERTSLSKSANFYSFGVHEGIMSGHVDYIKNSKTEWRIDYVGCTNPREFQATGSVPTEILDLHNSILQNASDDAEVDYEYEILSKSFEFICGLKYDTQHEFDFFILRKQDRRKPWWKFF